MVVEIAIGIVAAGFAVLVAYLVPTLIQVRRTVAESERLLARLNGEVPPLIQELRATAHNVNGMVEQARDGVEHASVLLHAVGDVGETVQQVHQVVRGKGSNVLMGVASLVAGVKAASAVVRDRMHKEEGGNTDGG